MMHTAIYLSNHESKQHCIEAIQAWLAEKNAAQAVLYSKLSLLQFLQEEYQHEQYQLSSQDKPLALMSEGEQKKALLAVIFQQKPAVLIVDDVFDSLDIEAQTHLVQQLQQLAEGTTIIQLYNRKRDCLPFIQRHYRYRQGQFEAFDGQFILPTAPASLQVPEPFEPPLPCPQPLIDMRHIHVSFDGKPVIADLSWQVYSREFWQLQGPNGSGKSTLLRMISGDSPKGFGQQLYLFGRKKGSGETVWQIKKQIGYFTNSMMLHFSKTESVMNMLLSGFFDSVGLYQKPSERHYRLAEQWLALIGLNDVAQQPFQQLALGHQRLLLVARAMVKHPPLLILDEPSSGLDEEDAVVLTALVNAMAATGQSSIIFVSHRHEPGLKAEKTLRLVPGEQGSVALFDA